MGAHLLTVERLGLLLGLSFFFGLSFEGFYWKSALSRPGGIRTFPLISLSGALLYALETEHATAFCVGLVVLGIWLYPYYRAEVSRGEASPETPDGLMVPVCNIVAYLLGPLALTKPPWISIGLTVLSVLLLQARERLHGLAQKIPGQEIITLAQFLVLIGVVLPLLPNEPITTLTPITPFQVWLAVVVVSSLSYGSYLLQKLIPAQKSLLLTSLLGGLYSSTATTVVLARRLRNDPSNRRGFQSAIVAATAMMYLRIGVVVGIFNLPLALDLALPLASLSVVGGGLAALCFWSMKQGVEDQPSQAPEQARNPLELPSALIFAFLFVTISVVSTWIEGRFGHVGIYWLAAIVGVTDVDPFVLSIAQGAVADLERSVVATAILLAASSNNVLKAVYSVAFAGWRGAMGVVLSLVTLGLLGGAIAAWFAHHAFG